MTEKEKETIEYWKRALNHYEYTKDLDLASDNYFGQFEEKINMISGMLNLIQKQQEEINRLRPYEELEYREFHELLKKETELEKKDKIIDLMAEQLTTYLPSREYSKEWVKKYYESEAKK